MSSRTIFRGVKRDPIVKKTAAQRGYDRDWRRLRNVKLTNDPICQCDDCKRDGLLTKAEVVDHILPISERPDLRLTYANLRSMSKRCHDRHTMRMRVANRTAPTNAHI